VAVFHMHSRLEAAEQARGKHHAKTYYSFDANAERESPPGPLGVRSGERRRQAKAIDGGDRDQHCEQDGFQ
jgi:hypothetical protein